MTSSTSRSSLFESTQTHHDRHGLYPEATTVEDFRHNLAAVQEALDRRLQCLSATNESNATILI